VNTAAGTDTTATVLTVNQTLPEIAILNAELLPAAITHVRRITVPN